MPAPVPPRQDVPPEPDLRTRLAQTPAAERSALLLAWLERREQEPEADAGQPAAIDLKQADLAGSQLRNAPLQSANLEEANLQDADLAGANLRGAQLGEALLAGAMLEDADLRQATLRYTQAPQAVLENSRLCQADLWGANLEGADLMDSDASGAIFDEANLKGANLAGVNFNGARLRHVDLTGANLAGADLHQADLSRTSLDAANLRGARLQGLVLLDCTMSRVHISGAWLDQTRLRQGQLGDAIGEEIEGDYRTAIDGYRALQINFEALGDPDAAGWAYLKKKRMQKWAAGVQAHQAFRQHRWRSGLRCGFSFVVKQLIEWLCDYGESISRVLGTMLFVYLAFVALYGLTDAVVKVQDTAHGQVRTVTHRPLDLAVYSIMVMTTSGQPPGFEGRTNATYAMIGIEAMLGISLSGLLGFVLGNRIRR